MDWSAWVGLDWKDRGRGEGGYDCWGLVAAAFEAGTGIALPSHSDGYSTAADRQETALILALETGHTHNWIIVPDGTERPFDVAVMRNEKRLHVGIVVRRGLLLHMPFRETSRIEPLTRFVKPEVWRHRRLSSQGD